MSYLRRFRQWFDRPRLADRSQFPALAPAVPVTPAQGSFQEIGNLRLDILGSAPVWMSRAERLLLFSLTYTLRPRCYLEIGTLHGGSAAIVNAALDVLGLPTKMVLVDPKPQIEEALWAALAPRAVLVQGFSPAVLPQAAQAAGERFDFVLIDGDHSRQGALADLQGVAACCRNGAYLLCHDCFYPEVEQAIDEFVLTSTTPVVDFGPFTRETTSGDVPVGDTLPWGGIRLLQVRA
jgi:cephalosporin hydroxylase